MTQHQTGIECDHSMGNDKSLAVPFALHHKGTVYLPWVYRFTYPSLWPIYAMIILTGLSKKLAARNSLHFHRTLSVSLHHLMKYKLDQK